MPARVVAGINVTVETWACAFGIKDQAAEMAQEMIKNAAKK